MATSSNLGDAHQRGFKNSFLWDMLYSFLVVRVRYWVYSARLSLWRGKEEEIIEDIIQEAIVGTLTYALQYVPGSGEKEVALSRSLLLVSTALAYQQYHQQAEHDAHLVETRLGYHRAQGFLAIGKEESAEWQESALSSAFQEWFCECLAGTVMKIPRQPRVALLTHWANHLHVGSQQARLLVRALSKRDVRLLEFQRSLPEDPREQSRHRALIRFAYVQMMREPEQERHLFLPGDANLVRADVVEEEHMKLTQEMLKLGVRLEATASSPRPGLSFREELCDKLLDLMVEYQIAQATTERATPDIVVAPVPGIRENEDAHREAQEPLASAESEDDQIDDSEIRMLTEFLQGMTPLAQIDPVFRATLREKLLAIPRVYAASQETKATENALAETERFLEQVPKEDCQVSDEAEDDYPMPLSLQWLQTQGSVCSFRPGVNNQLAPPGNN